jgi:hypothetical protein
MGLGHDGLSEIITKTKKKNTLFAKAMEQGGLVLFVNKSKTKLKLYSEDASVIGYLRIRGRGITEDAVSLIPRAFGGSVQYANAVKHAFATVVAPSYAKNSPVNRAELYAS